MTVRDLEALPAVLRDERAALVIAKTDQGNLAKLLVSAGLRKLKPSEKEGPLVPVLILERFETIDAGDRRSFKARGKEVMLFDGFQFDLDTGQVVPEGLGGDILFSTGAARGPAAGRSGRIASLHARETDPRCLPRSRAGRRVGGLSSRATSPAATT